jgi:hypothetical protein
VVLTANAEKTANVALLRNLPLANVGIVSVVTANAKSINLY